MAKLIDTRMAGEQMGVTREWVRRLIIAGELPGQRIGRDWVIVEDDLHTFIKERAAKKAAKETPNGQ